MRIIKKKLLASLGAAVALFTGMIFTGNANIYAMNGIEAVAENQMYEVTFSYTDAFGRERTETKSVAAGTDVAEYVENNLTLPYRYGYTLAGWSEKTVEKSGTIYAVYEKLPANGADVAADFSELPNDWEWNNSTTSHQGGMCTIRDGYLRMYRPSAFSRFATRQMYTEFQLEFDVVELTNVQMAENSNLVLILECGMQDSSFGAVNSAIGAKIVLNMNRDTGDMVVASINDDNKEVGYTRTHLYDSEKLKTVDYVTQKGNDCQLITESGLSKDYYVSYKVVVRKLEDGTSVREIFTKNSNEPEYQDEPDYTTNLGDLDTTGYVSVSGYSQDSYTDIILGIDNVKISNLAPREEELQMEFHNNATDSQGRYVHDTINGNISANIYLQNQALISATVAVDGKTVEAPDGFIKEAYDEIVEDITFDSKALGRIYLQFKDRAKNGVLELTVRLITVYDSYTFKLALSVPANLSVKFYDETGALLAENSGVLGQEIEFPSLNIGTKKFIGWENEDGVLVNDASLIMSANESYVAKFAKQYTVTFVDENGNTVKTQLVNEGEAAVAPELKKKGYAINWTGGNYLYVTENMVTKAAWTKLDAKESGCNASIVGLPVSIGILSVAVSETIRKKRK